MTRERRERQLVEEGLPQVLKRQMEKQLNQEQGNRFVISSSLLKTFIKTLTKQQSNTVSMSLSPHDRSHLPSLVVHEPDRHCQLQMELNCL
ncbi:hypothetical protein EYF80_015415 [Liparis tanakae]|uniref:Uncharacterized protein n=1 Tax=Liparis tanakae TaxID=230148 RepID=A0A4Z2IAB3_9TELE|nr:hypothetical protein EYF80_015415 [Liparis tanakae]